MRRRATCPLMGSGPSGRARPVVDLVVEGLELAPQACPLDTGASEVRMGRHVAELAGIDLGDAHDQAVASAARRLRPGSTA